MPVWLLVLFNLFFDASLIWALVKGRIGYSPFPFRGPRWVDRRENPYFFWFFTAVLTLICILAALRLAEAALPGFKPPAFLA